MSASEAVVHVALGQYFKLLVCIVSGKKLPLYNVRTDFGILLFIVQNSRPGKFWKMYRSWKTMEIPGKSSNSKAAPLDFLFPF